MTPQTPRWASLDDVERLADQWDPRVLECRTYGHHWQPSQATFNTKYRYYRVVQICPSCTSERIMELDSRGHIVKLKIDYADGYLSKHTGRIVGEGRDILRLATVTRTFDLKKERGGQAPAWIQRAS